MVKIGDFGFARTAAEPGRLMSPNACTQWYRAPELLMGACEYGVASDCWSAGCVIAELWHLRPLFRGRTLEEPAGPGASGSAVVRRGTCEVDQLSKIFAVVGTPTEASWPGHEHLVRAVEFQPCAPQPRLLPDPAAGPGGAPASDPNALAAGLLTLDPNQRLSAATALALPYFSEAPAPSPPHALPR